MTCTGKDVSVGQNKQFDIPMIETVAQLEDKLSEPTPKVIQAMAELDGDILILGAAGKMGPNLAQMAARAVQLAGVEKRITAVARKVSSEIKESFDRFGIEIISADLFDKEALSALPDSKNVMFMAGKKFGSTGDEWNTWAINTYLPGLVAERFADSRIVVFSTGNVYPMTPVAHGGASEDCPPAPVGEYAQSCLGRERIFEYFSIKNGTPCLIYRLCYAVELRYGIVLDIAQKVYSGQPIDLTMGHAVAIWQGDAVAQALRCFALCQSPPLKLNITGPETLSIRWLALELGRYLGKEPIFEGEEAETAFIFNASLVQELFGSPTVPLGWIVRWVAHWLKIGGITHNKPTHFEQREGKY